MKYLDRFINFVFSLVILVVSATIVLISAGFVEFSVATNYINETLFSTENNTITCIVSIIVFIASLKTTVFLSKTSPKKKVAIMVDTENGKVQIASETVENTAKNIAKSYDSVKDVQVKMVKERKGVVIYMALLVYPHTNIIELSSKVQDEVKEAIQSTTGVKVNNVDIKIKNLADKNGKAVKQTVIKEQVKEETAKVEENTVIDSVSKTENEEIKTETPVEEVEENNKEE